MQAASDHPLTSRRSGSARALAERASRDCRRPDPRSPAPRSRRRGWRSCRSSPRPEWTRAAVRRREERHDRDPVQRRHRRGDNLPAGRELACLAALSRRRSASSMRRRRPRPTQSGSSSSAPPGVLQHARVRGGARGSEAAFRYRQGEPRRHAGAREAQLNSSNDVTRAQLDLASAVQEVASDDGNVKNAYTALAFVVATRSPVSRSRRRRRTLQAAAHAVGQVDRSSTSAESSPARPRCGEVHRPGRLTSTRDEPLLRIAPTLGIAAGINGNAARSPSAAATSPTRRWSPP